MIIIGTEIAQNIVIKIDGVIMIIITFLQLILLYQQFRFNKKLNEGLMKREKGYFILDKTDCSNYDPEKRKYAFGRYSLNKKIDLLVAGSEGVILNGYSYIINGIQKEFNYIPVDVFFCKEDLLNIFSLEIDFPSIRSENIELWIELNLTNLSGMRYKEEIHLKFKKREYEDTYMHCYYSIKFK